MVTIKEIAKAAGVTPTTVSNVIHGKIKRVSPEMVEKINQLLKENNYIPRYGLNALTNRSSKMIGVLVNTPVFIEHTPYERPFYGTVIGTLENEFRKRGYYIMMLSSKEIHDVMRMALGWNVDGIISVSVKKKDYEEIAKQTGKPVVSIDMDISRNEDIGSCYNVTSKDYEAGRNLMEYMISRGFQNIVYLVNSKSGADYLRYHGAFEVYKEHFGNDLELEMVILGDTYEKRRLIFQKYADPAFKNTALIFSTDLNAVEAIGFFNENGIKVPDDLSIAGYDGDIYSLLSVPKLTTMRIDSVKKAEYAADMLLNLIEGKTIETRNLEMDVDLIKRNSVK